MSDPVQSFIDAEIANLQRIVPLQVPPFGYGTDLSCATDVTIDMSETDPNSVQGIAEMLVRWLITDRGSNPDAPERGTNIRRYLGKGMSSEQIRTARAEIINEATEDDRIASVTPTFEVVGFTQIKIRLSCVPQDPTLGNFSLIISATPNQTTYEIVTGDT